MQFSTQEEVRSVIRSRCETDGQRRVSSELGINQSVISLILAGKRDVSEAVAEKFGFHRRVVFAHSAAHSA